MARPFNIRPRYRPDEPTGGERIANGLVSGLDALSQEQEAQRAEENQYRQAGGVQVGKAPSAGDRFNGVKRTIGRVFGRGGPPSAFVDQTVPQLPAMRTTPTRAPENSIEFHGTSMSLPQQVARAQGQNPRPNGIGAALGGELGETHENDMDADDKPFELTARSGARYSFDPGRKERSAFRRDMAKIRLENQGRERVATIAANQRQESVKYTYGERRVIADRANASRERAAQIIASNRANTAEGRQEIQQAILDLREAALAMQQAGLEASGYENAAKALEAKIPSGTNRLVEESTPGGKQRIETAEEEAARLRRQAIDARRRGAGGGAGGAAKTPTPAQLQRAARDPEYRQFLVEKGYKVP